MVKIGRDEVELVFDSDVGLSQDWTLSTAPPSPNSNPSPQKKKKTETTIRLLHWLPGLPLNQFPLAGEEKGLEVLGGFTTKTDSKASWLRSQRKDTQGIIYSGTADLALRPLAAYL